MIPWWEFKEGCTESLRIVSYLQTTPDFKSWLKAIVASNTYIERGMKCLVRGRGVGRGEEKAGVADRDTSATPTNITLQIPGYITVGSAQNE